MTLQLDCRAASRLMSQALDEPLPPADRARLQLHVLTCDTCRIVDAQMGFLRRALRELDLATVDEPPVDR